MSFSSTSKSLWLFVTGNFYLKLKSYGIRGNLLSWIETFLCGHNRIGNSFVRSFVLRGSVRPSAVFRRAFSLLPALRPMWPRLVVNPSLGLSQCASPLTLGLVLYIYRAQLSQRVSLAGANMQSSYIRPLALAICCPHRRLSPHPYAPNPGVMACHSLKRTQANPLYLPKNLIS